jgi:hypothetical protein
MQVKGMPIHSNGIGVSENICEYCTTFNFYRFLGSKVYDTEVDIQLHLVGIIIGLPGTAIANGQT